MVLHEVAHGWVAEKLGDPTARALGRISLNPAVHVDPIMTIAVPAMLILSGAPFVIGGAKPVPVNPRYFKNPRKGMMLVALAGPVSNLIIASVCILTLGVVGLSPIIEDQTLLEKWLYFGAVINVILAVFNMFPVPPLDGGRILTGLLPAELAEKYARLEPYGFLIIVGLLMTGVLEAVLEPILFFLLTVLFQIWT